MLNQLNPEAMQWIKASERLPDATHKGMAIVFQLRNDAYSEYEWFNEGEDILFAQEKWYRWLDESSPASPEIERLKGLIEKVWFDGLDRNYSLNIEKWQQFKTDNNL